MPRLPLLSAAIICLLGLISLLPGAALRPGLAQAAGVEPAATELLGARYPALSPDALTVAFEYWGDIWTAPLDGSEPARRLTDHLAWDYLPRFSPDGTRIAFVSERSGNADVWVIPAAGGTAQQVTTFSGGDTLCGWMPDGTALLFESQRGLWGTDLYRVALDGSAPLQLTRLDHYNSVDGAVLPDGGYLYARGTGTWWRKGYRGTAQYNLWRILPDGKHVQLTDFNGRDEWPTLPTAGWDCYYVNNADGIDNLYRRNVESGATKKLTHHATDGVQFPCVAPGGSEVVYEWDGRLFTVPATGGSPQALKLRLAGESKDNWQARQSFNNQAGDFAVSPNGKYAVFVYAGDLWGIKDPKVYKEEDKPDQDLSRAWRLTASDGSRERMPAFAKDNRHVAYVSDADGDYEVWLLDLSDMSARQLTQNAVDDLSPQFDPQSENVLFYYSGNRQLVRSELKDGALGGASVVAEGRFRQAFGHTGFAVSPDGKWVAYVDELPDWSNEVYIRDSAGQQAPVNISRDPESDVVPQWSADGKWLLFNSSREMGRSSRGGSQWYAIELNPAAEKYDLQFLFDDDRPKPEAAPTPEAAAKPEAKPEEAGGKPVDAAKPEAKPEDQPESKPDESPESKPDEKQEDKKDEKKDAKPVEVLIDFSDIHLRARRVTTQTGTGSAVISADGKWVVYECNPDGSQQIWAAQVKGGEAKRIHGGGWSSPALADSGKRIYYRDGGTLRYMKFNDGNNQGVEGLDAHGEFELNKRARWRQMYREGWRTLGEMFYDKQLHGADWPAVYAKYLPLVEAAGTPEEFGLLFSEVLGELNASHLAISMAERSYATTGKTTCHLGLEFEPAFPGPGLQVSHVTYQGPADAPGLDIAAGDVLLKVDGREVGAGQAWESVLDDRAGQPVPLTFAAREGGADAAPREVLLKPCSYGTYQELLYREWELQNEAKVAELSGGRIGYIHIRGMNGGELAKFKREFFSEHLDKDALLVDVRFNPGGFIHEELFDLLDRNPFGFAAQRDAAQKRQPARSFDKPKALLINARSGSDAEIFPEGWRALGLGPVIGIDTAGAVIGTTGFDLIDGTGVRLPVEGWWGLDQRNLEQSGTKPDIYVDVNPGELAQGKDAQLERAVAELMRELETAV